MNFRPITFCAASIIFGIVAANFFATKVYYAAYIVIAVAFLCIVSFLLLTVKSKTFKRNLIFSIIFALVFSLGAVLYTVNLKDYENADLSSPTVSVTGRITEERSTENGKRFTVGNAILDGIYKGNLYYKICVYVNGDTEAELGDIINFKTTLYDKNIIYEGEINVYPIAENIKYDAYVTGENIEIVKSSPSVFERVNLFMRDSLKEGLGDNEYPVGYALLCGNSDYMDSELLTDYRNAGVAHIFAVSGLHINFLATALGFMLSKLRMEKYGKFSLIVLVLFFYSGVCGFSSSSIRAAIMSSVFMFSDIIGKRYDNLTSLSIAAIIITLIFPMQVFCVGFQLSFAVVLGILLLGRPISALFKFLPAKISLSLGTVFAAQIVGIPICLASFGEFSVIAIIANLIFIPFVAFLYIFTFVATILGGLLNIPTITLFLPNYLFVAVNFIISVFDYGIFIIGGFTLGVFCIPYYASVILYSGLFNFKRVVKICAVCILAVICAAGCFTVNYIDGKHVKLYAIGSSGICATVIRGDSDALILSEFEKDCSLARVDRAVTAFGIKCFDYVFIPRNENKIDSQIALTRLRQVAEVRKVYLCENLSESEITVLEKSFPETEFYICSSGDRVGGEVVAYTFTAEGYAVEIKTENTKGLIFSRVGETFDSYGKGEGYGLIIANDCAERIFSAYQSDNYLVYRRNNIYYDAETRGNYLYSLS